MFRLLTDNTVVINYECIFKMLVLVLVIDSLFQLKFAYLNLKKLLICLTCKKQVIFSIVFLFFKTLSESISD